MNANGGPTGFARGTAMLTKSAKGIFHWFQMSVVAAPMSGCATTVLLPEVSSVLFSHALYQALIARINRLHLHPALVQVQVSEDTA